MAEAERRVAWVTGASRGVGRGVAIALGQAGWVVYVTARSSVAERTGHLPGTVEQTADAVTAAGGQGVAVRCDHRDDAAVRAVADRIAAEHGVASVAVHPDWVRTEGVLQFADQIDLSSSQSPEGVGRAIAALAGDPEVMSLTGQTLAIETLATRYGVDVCS
jgi:NAD(P)-dependent dehydrogenase (short-subunit alcohol dehydrogenase family)